jgi:hypothetical protein
MAGIADVLHEGIGLVTEFDGQDHRWRAQHRADKECEKLVEDAGLAPAWRRCAPTASA